VGSLAKANSLAALVGGVILAGLAFGFHLDRAAPSSIEGSLAFQGVICLLSLLGAWLIIFVVRLLGAPARVHAITEKALTDSLDRRDQESLLGGHFIGSVFVYGGECNLCKRYGSALDLGALRDGFDLIPVRAPRGSTAMIRLRFMHSREAHDFAFVIRDRDGVEKRVEDIYTDQIGT
jgi:hypothetical protein